MKSNTYEVITNKGTYRTNAMSKSGAAGHIPHDAKIIEIKFIRVNKV